MLKGSHNSYRRRLLRGGFCGCLSGTSTDTSKGVSDLIDEYKVEQDKWSRMKSRISAFFQQQKQSLIDSIDEVIAELQKKKSELEKQQDDDQLRALKQATPQVPVCDSLENISGQINALKSNSARSSAAELDWIALAKLIDLAKFERDNAPKKGLADSIEMKHLLCWDKGGLDEVSEGIATQSLEPVAISFPSLPFTLPQVTGGRILCIGRRSPGHESWWETKKKGPISWYVHRLVYFFCRIIFPLVSGREFRHCSFQPIRLGKLIRTCLAPVLFLSPNFEAHTHY